MKSGSVFHDECGEGMDPSRSLPFNLASVEKVHGAGYFRPRPEPPDGSEAAIDPDFVIPF